MFYGTDDGNKLVDENNYPPSIRDYLDAEKQMLIRMTKENDAIIEVGCMEARNMDVAVMNGKKYIGIDIVPEYIDIAKRIVRQRKLESKCEFLCIDAEKLDEILQQSELLKESKSPLFFFPFNSFGNMTNFDKVIESITRIKNSDFAIFTYKTDASSTGERKKYYSNCGYSNLRIIQESEGIRFTADDGLSSIAYDETFLLDFIKNRGLAVETQKFSDIGIAYVISTRERHIDR